MTPAELKYTQSHEWVSLDQATGVATVGITDFAVAQLGDIVYVELPSPGSEARQGEPLAAIESVKAAVDIYAPVSGEVTEVNEAVAEDFDIFKEDAYGRAWMVKIKTSGAGGLDGLMTADQYEAHIQDSHQ